MITHLGSKGRMIRDFSLLDYFKRKDCFIDLFSGSLDVAISYNAKYTFCNDYDNELFNLYKVWQNDLDSLVEAVFYMPKHRTLFIDWLSTPEINPVLRAAKTLMHKNFSLYGTCSTMRIGVENTKDILIKNIQNLYGLVSNFSFFSLDFESALKAINFKKNEKGNIFIYADPPYIGRRGYPNCPPWVESDLIRLIEALIKYNEPFCISEFDSENLKLIADEYNLFYYRLGERANIKSRAVEVVLTSYEVKKQQLLFDSAA